MPTLHPDRLAAMLEREPLAALARVAARRNRPVALVGGAVRDLMLGRTVDDLDIVVEGDLAEYLAGVEKELGRRPTAIGDRFQDTHRMRVRGIQIDISRSMGSLAEDLERRDFTVNALAVRLPAANPPVIDDAGSGLDDLAAGILRETRPGVLAADPLRLLRGIRYSATLGGFALEGATRSRIAELASQLDVVASERVQYEWQRVLEADEWVRGVLLAEELGLARQVFGARVNGAAISAWARAESSPDAIVRLAALIVDLAGDVGLAPIEQRLTEMRWPRRSARSAVRIARWSMQLTGLDEPAAAAWALEDSYAAEQAAQLGRSLDVGLTMSDELLTLARRAREPRWVQGADLRGWGMSAGQPLGELLHEVWIGQLLSRWPDRETCRCWAREQASGGDRVRA